MGPLILPDGRALDIEVTGPDGGTPLVFHHGTPGAVSQSRAIRRATHARGLRLVTYSRAGYGTSTRRPGRSVVDDADDTAAVLDHLGADRCVVAGWSGGGPHALATAARHPDRVAGVLTLSSLGPFRMAGISFIAGMGEQNIEEFGLSLGGETALRPYLEAEATTLRKADVDTLVAGLTTLLCRADRAVLTDEFGEDTLVGFVEAVRVGVDGWIDDDIAFSLPWGFDLSDITVPTFIWHGSDDLMVPFAHGRWLAEHIPGAVAHLEPREGHLSLGLGALDEMLDELATTLPR